MTPLKDKEIRQRNNKAREKYLRARSVIEKALVHYYETACQCAFKRYQQIVGIDCVKTGDSFKCLDTELVISLSKKHFTISKSDRKNEVINEKWTCKKCGSIYEYGWSDFSISVDRQKLELITLKTEGIGKQENSPIPVFLGIMGHSYPSKHEIKQVDFIVFEEYYLEKN